MLQTHDAPAHPVDHRLIVCRYHNGRALEIDALEQFHDLGGVGRVEVARRLVAQQQLGVADERSRDRRALHLAPGEF